MLEMGESPPVEVFIHGFPVQRFRWGEAYLEQHVGTRSRDVGAHDNPLGVLHVVGLARVRVGVISKNRQP